MQKLIEGYRMFRSFVYPQKEGFYHSLKSGQNPQALFITCSDSRVQPTEFLSASPGELFTGRSLGNMVPEFGGPEIETPAIIEYAVVALKVAHIVVCGHSECGAIKALLTPAALKDVPTVANWLAHAGPTLENVRRKYGDLDGQALLDATIRENVLVQLDHLRRHPCVAERLGDGRVKIHGWVKKLETGEVFAHDTRVDRFVPLEAAYT